MEEKEKNIYKKKNILLSIPFEIDQRYRSEAKKREIPISDLLERLIEERDYFEKKIVEKDRIIENGTEIVHKNIVESLSEIKKTNLHLEIVSKSLSSIPQVTEEARRINEHCTKSANVIVNFNKVVSDINETISELRQKMNGYHKVLSSNKTNAEEIDSYLINTKKLLENGWKVTVSSLQEEKDKIVTEFKNNMKLKIDEIIDYEKLKTNTLNDLFNRKIIIFFVLWIVVSTFLAGLYIHNSYVRSGIDSDKIKVFNNYKVGLCQKENRTVANVDYLKLCN